MIGQVPYDVVGDEQAFSWTHFKGATWWSHARNLQHFAAERGRLACAFDNLYLPIDLNGTTVTVPVEATPHEGIYRVWVELAIQGQPVNHDLQMTWSVSTTDAGAHTSTDPTYQTAVMFGHEQDESWLAFRREMLLPGNDPALRGLVRSFHGPANHVCHASLLPLRDLSVTVSALFAAGESYRQGLPAWLMGIYATGYTNGDGVW